MRNSRLVQFKSWKWIKATLGLAIAFLLFGTPQRSLAIYAAIIVKQNIIFNGNVGSYVDSYNGSYNPEAPDDNGNVISVDGQISIGNAFIFGDVWIGPGGGYSIGPNGGISGYVSSDSPIFDFPTVALPYTTGVAPGPGTNVVMVNAGTNIVVTNSSTPPPVPEPNQTIACTTNSYYLTNSSYPGPMPGLVTNVTITLASTNIILVTNCSSTQAVYIGTNPPPPEIYCPGTTPLQIKGNRWYYYPITGISTNPVYLFSTNYTFIWEQTNYDYQIYQPPTYQTNYYDHILCGNYCAGSLAGLTLVTCPSTLVMTNGLNLTGVDSVTIMPGASLLLYVDGGSVTIAGGGIANISGVDTNLQIYCTPAVTSLSVGTSTPMSAEIIAPNTFVVINAGGNNSGEFYGNIMASSFEANGAVHLHGDEAVSLPTQPVAFASAYPPPLLPAQTNAVAVVGWQVDLSAGPIYSGMSLQWYFNGTNLIANATNSSMSFSNVTTDMAGEYTLQESSPGLLLVSQPAWLTVVTTPAATLNSFSVTSSNQFQFQVNGLPGYLYDVEGSSNLIDWTPIGSGQCPFTFSDPNHLGVQYFYRAGYTPGEP